MSQQPADSVDCLIVIPGPCADIGIGMPIPAKTPTAPSMNALRLNQGFDVALFETRTSLPLQSIESTLRQAEIDGLIERTAQRIAPTKHGQRFLNRLLEMFLSEHH